MKTEPSDYMRTPPEIFEPLHAKHQFAVDLCANDENHLVDVFLGEEINALSYGWRTILGTRDWGFWNPPYSRGHLDAWCAKARLEATWGVRSVGLIPATPGAGWFQRHLYAGASATDSVQYPEHAYGALAGIEHRYSLNAGVVMAIRWLSKRPAFLRPDGSRPKGGGLRDSALVWLSRERWW